MKPTILIQFKQKTSQTFVLLCSYDNFGLDQRKTLKKIFDLKIQLFFY